MAGFQSSDTGIVIYDEFTNEYFAGLNTFNKWLRNAKIYHSEKYVKQVLKKYNNRPLKTRRVTIQIVEEN